MDITIILIMIVHRQHRGEWFMKKILIYDVAAEKTGAATVLAQYYQRYVNDETIETFIVTSVMDFPGNHHTKIIKLPWTKKTHIHRLYCDYFYIQRLVRKYKINEVINLQNIAIKKLKIPQTLYLHNAIPISDVNFHFRKEWSLWLFKHVISKMILSNLKYADKIIVQAEWIKTELITRFNMNSDNIVVEKVKPTFSGSTDRIASNSVIFFYPANLCSYKNHQCIVEACKLLHEKGNEDYEVIFTLDPETEGRKLAEQISFNELPIKMVGILDKKQMEEYYRKSVLIFPSYLETVGLPLIEAQLFNAEIIAADILYARETIGEYKKVKWFDYRSPTSLFTIMEALIINYQALNQ